MASKVFFTFLTVSLLLLGPLGAPYMGGGATAEAVQLELTIECGELKFGQVVTDSFTTGTVVIDPATGFKTVQGGAIDLGGAHSRAECLVRGNGKFVITVVPTDSLSGTGSPIPITVTLFPSNTGVFGPNGLETVFFGGTLQLPPGQLPGTYSGPFTVFVDKP